MGLNLSNLNGVLSALTSPGINTSQTSVSVDAAVAPYITPPDPGAAGYYYLRIVDHDIRPEAWEIVKVTARSGTGPYTLTVVRNIASSTGSGIAFSTPGSFAEWFPDTFSMENKLRTILSAGGDATSPWRLSPTVTVPQYFPIDGFYSNAVDTTGDESRWYNNLANSVKVSRLLMYSYDHSHAADITLEVYIDGVASGVSVIMLAADPASVVKTDNVNEAIVAPGSYIYIKATSAAASEAGRLYIARAQLLVEEE